jgi:lysophospholipase L1-like esterase
MFSERSNASGKRRPVRRGFLLLALFLGLVGLELTLQAAGLAARWIYRPRLAHPGAPAILCLGDSHTFGVFVPVDLTYPAQLEQLLAAQGHTVNVVNLGAPGTNTSEIRRNLPEWIARYRPAAVVVLAGVNDGWNQADAIYAELEDGQLQDRPHRLWRARILNGLSYLKTYRLLAYLFRRMETGRKDVEQARDHEGRLVLHDGDPAAAQSDPDGDARRAYRNLCRIGDLGRERKVPVILMTYMGKPPTATFPGPNDRLRAVSHNCSMPLVDNDAILHPELVSPNGVINSDLVKRLFFADAHPAAEGYSRIAANVAQALIELHVLPGSGASNENP